MNITRRLFKFNIPVLNFNKSNKFFYKKRMGLNHIDLMKAEKIEQDYDEMIDSVDWIEEAAEIQSHFYHEFIFAAIGKKFFSIFH